MSAESTFRIDAFPESAFRYIDREAIVCIDVINSTTTVVSAVAQERRVLPVSDHDEAQSLRRQMPWAVLAGGFAGAMPPGFELPDSPSALADLDPLRPLILAGAGISLLTNSARASNVYVACFRNASATAAHIARTHSSAIILGAGAGGEFRCEDQMAAAMIGRVLTAHGFDPEDRATADVVARWGRTEPSLARYGKSAAELLRTRRAADLDFVVSHFDDLQLVCRYSAGEVAPANVIATSSGEAVRRPGPVWWREEAS